MFVYLAFMDQNHVQVNRNEGENITVLNHTQLLFTAQVSVGPHRLATGSGSSHAAWGHAGSSAFIFNSVYGGGREQLFCQEASP